jgi:hypothetical protein
VVDFDRVLDAGAVIRWRALELIKGMGVDLLDMNATVLRGLDAVGDFRAAESGSA